jgi:hypothetical protein
MAQSNMTTRDGIDALCSAAGFCLASCVLLFFSASDVEAEDSGGGPEEHNLKFFGADIGVVSPIGSAESFFLPNTIAFSRGAPEPYADYFSAGITTNFYAGIMTDKGFESSISFKITKVNYSNFAEGIIQAETRDITRSGSFSSYLLGSQVYIGQRMKPISESKESLYFGVAADFSTLKHYSNLITAADDQTLGVSFIAGQEVLLLNDRNTQRLFTFRVQVEFVAIASSERARYFGLTFGFRQYFQ